jgi:hypothetical protein
VNPRIFTGVVTYFNAEIDDATLYDVMLNTAKIMTRAQSENSHS